MQVLRPLGETYKKTISNTATALPAIPTGAVRAYVQVETQPVRIKFNATNSVTYGVTAGVGGGLLLPVNTIACPWYVIEGRSFIERARLYRDQGSDGFINVIYQGDEPINAYLGGLA